MSNNLTEELLEFCTDYIKAFETGNEEDLTKCYYAALRLKEMLEES